jgi:hypothetical protein
MLDADKYPMHAKLEPLQHLSQAVYDFLEWCDEQGFFIAQYDEANGNAYGIIESRQRLLARHFEIDLDALENEKRAIIDECRAVPSV